jgi:hypothetical protein
VEFVSGRSLIDFSVFAYNWLTTPTPGLGS